MNLLQIATMPDTEQKAVQAAREAAEALLTRLNCLRVWFYTHNRPQVAYWVGKCAVSMKGILAFENWNVSVSDFNQSVRELETAMLNLCGKIAIDGWNSELVCVVRKAIRSDSMVVLENVVCMLEGGDLRGGRLVHHDSISDVTHYERPDGTFTTEMPLTMTPDIGPCCTM